MADIRDLAASTAESTAPLTALLHVLAHEPVGMIGANEVDTAARIIVWHLHEARRLLSDLDTPTDLTAAISLADWLIAEANRAGSQRIATDRIY